MTADDKHRLSARRFLGAVGASAGAVSPDPANVVASPGHGPRQGDGVPSCRQQRARMRAIGAQPAPFRCCAPDPRLRRFEPPRR
jgi:hypothetical protein